MYVCTIGNLQNAIVLASTASALATSANHTSGLEAASMLNALAARFAGEANKVLDSESAPRRVLTIDIEGLSQDDIEELFVKFNAVEA